MKRPKPRHRHREEREDWEDIWEVEGGNLSGSHSAEPRILAWVTEDADAIVKDKNKQKMRRCGGRTPERYVELGFIHIECEVLWK